jgi:hypothetical protein
MRAASPIRNDGPLPTTPGLSTSTDSDIRSNVALLPEGIAQFQGTAFHGSNLPRGLLADSVRLQSVGVSAAWLSVYAIHSLVGCCKGPTPHFYQILMIHK